LEAKGDLVMRLFSRLWCWQAVRLLARHAVVILTMLTVLLLVGNLDGKMIGVYAQGTCTAGDQLYTVVIGDTLSSIAARYHTSWQRLASYNHLPNPNLIFLAQTLCIPGSSSRTGGGLSMLQYMSLARQDAQRVGIPPETFVRQINEESGFNPSALSPVGAIGIAQFMPATAAALGINPYDPIDSLWGAASLMASYVRTYYDYAKALAAYNAGPGAVQIAVRKGGSNWRAYLPLETQRYIYIILG
jgi:soluble lytic murein transglycosylase-like protein